jgi:hypothetical protein
MVGVAKLQLRCTELPGILDLQVFDNLQQFGRLSPNSPLRQEHKPVTTTRASGWFCPGSRKTVTFGTS